MNKSALKNYAVTARRDFIDAIRNRAYIYDLDERGEPDIREENLDVIIKNQAYPKKVGEQVKKLAAKIKNEGFNRVVEDIAYTWFNRFVALRYMELHGFLPHGLRVLSNPENTNTPEILQRILDVELPSLKREEIIELKSKNADAELYRKILVAQCNALNPVLPFLFERINDETELLLPDNLLRSDSVIRKLVEQIEEEDWQEVEIIGWLYQFYISERKDEVIGKTVKTEDIPAATQLFTPNWIVKYMTQNSLGRLWLEANPTSKLAEGMEFYIAGSEHLAVSGEQLKPEEIRVLDPACGSGHILVEAYDLLKAIYLERGYRLRDIPMIILEKNLFGLDIDKRAVQLASFALLMKARNDDRRIFEKINEQQIPNPKSQIPNIYEVPDSSELEYEPAGIAEMFFSDAENRGAIPIRDSNYLFAEMDTQPSLVQSSEFGVQSSKTEDQSPKTEVQITEQNIIDLIELFENGKTYGSLIRIPHGFERVVEAIARLVETKAAAGNMNEQIAVKLIKPFVQAARILGTRYDAVIANPPYMGGKGMNGELKNFAKREFPESKSDLFAMFIERIQEMLKPNGQSAFVTPFVWMFISSYEKFRNALIDETSISSLIQLEYNAFEPACVPVCTFTLKKDKSNETKGEFIKLSDFKGHQNQAPKTLEAINNPDCGWRFQASSDDFKKIPGSPIAYWASDRFYEIFSKSHSLSSKIDIKFGMRTGDNDRFLRQWYEISLPKIGFAINDIEDFQSQQLKWLPYAKGGSYRRWYGNHDYVVNWENAGEEIKENTVLTYPDIENVIEWKITNEKDYLRKGITWSRISSSYFGVRLLPTGFIFSDAACGAFPKEEINESLGILCSKVASEALSYINPTLTYQVGDVKQIPFIALENSKTINEIVEEAVSIARADWDSFETSWDFSRLPILDFEFWSEEKGEKPASVEEAYNLWEELTEQRIKRMQELETENNRLFIEAYGLEDELSPEVPLDQITLARADRIADTKRLLSYFVGCAMGRYSLDKPGLVYADAGNKGFDASNYQTFPADEDGIIPVTDMEWFPQEAALRFAHFVRVAFGEEGETRRQGDGEMEESLSASPRPRISASDNLKWIAEGLGKKANETPVEAIRRYFSKDFFKDHVQTYKKRPIYWLFSSGKEKAFECLVYLHRYNELTLARMRTDYVTPLFGKFNARIESLEEQIASETLSSAQVRKAEKEIESFKKKYAELQKFDDELHALAEKRISIDLDDGVKVNYGRFGNLLAMKKQIAK